jgi:hypothetical protein
MVLSNQNHAQCYFKSGNEDPDHKFALHSPTEIHGGFIVERGNVGSGYTTGNHVFQWKTPHDPRAYL